MKAGRRSNLTSSGTGMVRRFCAPPSAQLPDADEGAGEHDGFVIITADSAGGMVDIHVVLAPELAQDWLDLDTPKERAEQMILHQGEPAEAFEWFKVSTSVGNVWNQGVNLVIRTLDP